MSMGRKCRKLPICNCNLFMWFNMPWSDRLQTKRLQIEQNNNFLFYKLESIFIPLALRHSLPLSLSLYAHVSIPLVCRLAAMVWLMIRCQGQPDHCHDYCSSCLSITNSAQFGQINIKFDKRRPKSYGIKALKWAIALMSEWLNGNLSINLAGLGVMNTVA